MKALIVAVSVLFAFTDAASLVAAGNAAPPSGYLVSISGHVRLITNNTKRTLDPKHDAASILYAGQTLQCANDSHAMGYLTGSPKAHFMVLQDLCKISGPLPAPGSDQSMQAALRSYGQRAGREKGEDTLIYSPPDKGAVQPENFVIHWRTRPPLDTFTAVLQDGDGKELARVTDVSATGVLSSGFLKDALIRYAKMAGDHAAKLIFRSNTQPDQSVAFTVLTSEQEADLKGQLAANIVPNSSFHYVQRAAIFESFKLYDEVAAEYDAALNDAPESRDLLTAAFNAHSRIGDFHSAHDLRDRLAKVQADN